MNNFKLGLFDTGAGVTVCDCSKYEHGDYKKVAFIHDTGILQFYEKPENIPGADLLRIEYAADMRAAYYRDCWNKKSINERLYYILDLILSVPGLDSVYNDIKTLDRAEAVFKYEYFILERKNIMCSADIIELYTKRKNIFAEV